MSAAPADGEAPRLASLLLPVEDMEAACAVLSGPLGLSLKFRDGDRYAAFDLNGLTLALLGGAERITDGPALGLRVADLEPALARLAEAGARAGPPEEGPHERRATLALPGGVPAVLSAKT